ncbi:MAG: DUF21 domain-containing protein [candidate division Zixibacteria bacterium]|nr:DUF21 domain-containing protein [candidate division Zixibacteria bacterium]
MEILTWVGIFFCLTQSSMFSGLNLAVFGVTRLRLEVEDTAGNEAASKVLKFRDDSNFLLTTILWGNVAFNTLLALLSNSVLAGVVAFVFSTFIITFVGEILPQAYFSRHALRMASMLTPMLRFYQVILYPVAKPSARLLDWWLGKEGIQFFREHQLREVIKKHIEAEHVDIDRLEGLGALNFLALDDIEVHYEGELIDPESVIVLPVAGGMPVFPEISRSVSDSFLRRVQKSGKKWVVIADESGTPALVLDADGFLRAALFESGPCDPTVFCHRPIVAPDDRTALGDVLHRLTVEPRTDEDDVIDRDIILVWGSKKRIITGADILGRLLRGIAVGGHE